MCLAEAVYLFASCLSPTPLQEGVVVPRRRRPHKPWLEGKPLLLQVVILRPNRLMGMTRKSEYKKPFQAVKIAPFLLFLVPLEAGVPSLPSSLGRWPIRCSSTMHDVDGGVHHIVDEAERMQAAPSGERLLTTVGASSGI